MKARLITLAALAGSGVASAQSSVTLFGVVDAAMGSYSTKSEDQRRPTPAAPFILQRGTVTTSRTALVSSGFNSSRIGFRGTEDLGGGLAAGFWLEAPLTNDDGATGIGTFSRRSTLSLSGGFGEVRLGRDYSPTFWNDSVNDPFAQVGPGANIMLAASTSAPGFAAHAANYARVSNTIGYFLPPSLGGFYGQAMYGFHENTRYDPGTGTPPGVTAAGRVNSGAVAPVRTGRYVGGRVGYANGPLDVAIAYSIDTTADNFYVGTTDFVKTANLGASYDFGFLKLSGELSKLQYERDYRFMPSTGAVPGVDLTGYMVGVSVPVGVGTIRASFGHVRYDIARTGLASTPGVADPKASKFALGYVHNLSRRTALYAIAARVRNKNGAGLTAGNPAPAYVSDAIFTPKASSGYVIGIRHSF